MSSSLRLLVTATNAVGVLTLAGRDRIAVTGTIGTDGTLTLGGSKPAASAFDGSGEVVLTRFLLRRDLQKGLVGELAYSAHYTMAQNGETSLVEQSGVVLSASRESSDTAGTGSFSGHWVGYFVVRRCLAVGWATCVSEQVDHLYPLDLTLSQVGATVSGTLDLGSAPGPLTVNGVAPGSTLTLNGIAMRTLLGINPDLLRLTAWSTARDDLGQLHGMFSYTRETHWVPPATQTGVWIQDIDVELVGVVRER